MGFNSGFKGLKSPKTRTRWHRRTRHHECGEED